MKFCSDGTPGRRGPELSSTGAQCMPAWQRPEYQKPESTAFRLLVVKPVAEFIQLFRPTK